MQVNVFVARNEDRYHLLVLPYGPHATIPDSLQHTAWRHLAVAHLNDRLLTGAGPIIEAQLGSQGYALLPLKT